MRSYLRDIKAITPVISTIILVAVTITVGLAAVFYLRNLATPQPIEHLALYTYYIVDETGQGSPQEFILYTLSNLGTGTTVVELALLDYKTVTPTGLPLTLVAGASASLKLSYLWQTLTNYRTEAISKQGIHWIDLSKSPLIFSSGGPCSYALWAGTSVVWPGSGSTISGSIHTNGDFTMSGSSNNVTMSSRTEYVGSFTVNSQNSFGTISKVNATFPPFTYNINDYKPGGTAAQAAQTAGKYHYVQGDLHFSTNNVTISPGLYYVTGSVQVSASQLSAANVTFVAEQNIAVSGSYDNFTPYDKTLLFYSNTGSIQAISGSYNTMRGVIYDPTGQASLPGSYNTLNGYILAQQVNVPGSNWLFQTNSAYCPV